MRKVLMLAAVAVLPACFIVGSSGVASATVIDNVGAPESVLCGVTGGSINFKVGLGNGGSYVVPTKNKGNKITLTAGLSCSASSHVTGTFTGTLSGKITTTNTSQTPAQFYSCASLVGDIPTSGGTLSGPLKIKWNPPSGQQFSLKDSVVSFSDVLGTTFISLGFVTYADFEIPNVNPIGVTGAFPGPDGGASSLLSLVSAEDEGAIAAQCGTPGGLTSLPVGTAGGVALG